MDERIKQGYHKIYSEMYLIILSLAAVSLVVNTTFFRKTISQCWFEYVILVGSPIYRLIRIRMLEIVDAPAAGWKRGFGIRLAAALACAFGLLVIVSFVQTGGVEILPLIGFMIPFAALFCLVAFATKKLQESWKRALDKKYEDNE